MSRLVARSVLVNSAHLPWDTAAAASSSSSSSAVAKPDDAGADAVPDHWKDRHSAWSTHRSAQCAAVLSAPDRASVARSLLPGGRKPTVGGLNPNSVLMAHAPHVVVVVVEVVVVVVVLQRVRA